MLYLPLFSISHRLLYYSLALLPGDLARVALIGHAYQQHTLGHSCSMAINSLFLIGPEAGIVFFYRRWTCSVKRFYRSFE